MGLYVSLLCVRRLIAIVVVRFVVAFAVRTCNRCALWHFVVKMYSQP